MGVGPLHVEVRQKRLLAMARCQTKVPGNLRNEKCIHYFPWAPPFLPPWDPRWQEETPLIQGRRTRRGSSWQHLDPHRALEGVSQGNEKGLQPKKLCSCRPKFRPRFDRAGWWCYPQQRWLRSGKQSRSTDQIQRYWDRSRPDEWNNEKRTHVYTYRLLW